MKNVKHWTVTDKIITLLDNIKNNGDHEVVIITGTFDHISSKELDEINQVFHEQLFQYLVSVGSDRIGAMMKTHHVYVESMIEHFSGIFYSSIVMHLKV